MKKSKLIKFKDDFDINRNKYNLVISSDPTHPFVKKFFSKRIEKDYNSYAYTTIITHKKIKNNTAFQNFTKKRKISKVKNKEQN